MTKKAMLEFTEKQAALMTRMARNHYMRENPASKVTHFRPNREPTEEMIFFRDLGFITFTKIEPKNPENSIEFWYMGGMTEKGLIMLKLMGFDYDDWKL